MDSEYSKLLPLLYSPTEKVQRVNHVAIFVNENPFLLCGNSRNLASFKRAIKLLQSASFLRMLNLLGWGCDLKTGEIPGGDIDWTTPKSVITAPSGPDTKARDVVALFLCDPDQIMATLCCINDELAEVFFPESTDWFHHVNLAISARLTNPGTLIVQ